jgi:hypothetical protein
MCWARPGGDRCSVARGAPELRSTRPAAVRRASDGSSGRVATRIDAACLGGGVVRVRAPAGSLTARPGFRRRCGRIRGTPLGRIRRGVTDRSTAWMDRSFSRRQRFEAPGEEGWGWPRPPSSRRAPAQRPRPPRPARSRPSHTSSRWPSGRCSSTGRREAIGPRSRRLPIQVRHRRHVPRDHQRQPGVLRQARPPVPGRPTNRVGPHHALRLGGHPDEPGRVAGGTPPRPAAQRRREPATGVRGSRV